MKSDAFMQLILLTMKIKFLGYPFCLDLLIYLFVIFSYPSCPSWLSLKTKWHSNFLNRYSSKYSSWFQLCCHRDHINNFSKQGFMFSKRSITLYHSMSIKMVQLSHVCIIIPLFLLFMSKPFFLYSTVNILFDQTNLFNFQKSLVQKANILQEGLP